MQPDIDKTYSYAKDLYEAKYQSLINKQENTGLTQYKIDLFGAAHGWGRRQKCSPWHNYTLPKEDSEII